MSDETYEAVLAETIRNPEAAGYKAACRLKDIEIAELKLALAREKYNHAGLQITHYTLMLEKAKNASRNYDPSPVQR